MAWRFDLKITWKCIRCVQSKASKTVLIGKTGVFPLEYLRCNYPPDFVGAFVIWQSIEQSISLRSFPEYSRILSMLIAQKIRSAQPLIAVWRRANLPLWIFLTLIPYNFKVNVYGGASSASWASCHSRNSGSILVLQPLISNSFACTHKFCKFCDWNFICLDAEHKINHDTYQILLRKIRLYFYFYADHWHVHPYSIVYIYTIYTI